MLNIDFIKGRINILNFNHYIFQATKLGACLNLIAVLILTGCGGGGGDSNSASNTHNQQYYESLTPPQIKSFTDAGFIEMGTNIQYLQNDTLGALSGYAPAQIGSITAAQIAVLTPTQIRLIGSTGAGGATTTSKIYYLNTGAWAQLVSDATQVAAITPAEIQTLFEWQVLAMDTNIQHLSDESLGALSGYSPAQIGSLTAAQIAVLTPAQIRLIGSTGAGGATTTSKIYYFNTGAWGQLVSDPAQVAGITPNEIQTLFNWQIIAIGTNFSSLSNAALGAINTNFKIDVITAVEIAALTPEQVRYIGSTGAGGATSAAMIYYLNTGTWGQLVGDPLQVAAITAGEIPPLYAWQIIALGTNIQYLSDAALGALQVVGSGGYQIGSVTAAQIAILTPAQIEVIAGINNNFGISYLNSGAFGALSSTQIAILTVAQLASLSAAQHTSCGC